MTRNNTRQMSQQVTFFSISTELGKKIVKLIKDNKCKMPSSIQVYLPSIARNVMINIVISLLKQAILANRCNIKTSEIKRLLIDPCYSNFSCGKPKLLLSKEQQQQDAVCMQQTFAVSPTSAIEEVPIQAMITHPELGVLSQAHSSSIALHDPTAHAEILAVRHAADKLQNYRLIGCTLYTSLRFYVFLCRCAQ